MAGALIVAIALLAAGQLAGDTATCLRVEREVAAEAFVVRDDFSRTACSADADAALRYDRAAGAARAARALRIGEVVSGLPEFAIAGVRPGQTLFLTTHVGPVTVQRQVTALQPGRPGQPLFVRGEDGGVFAIPYPEDLR